MDQLIDFIPLLAFFISYKCWDIFIATAVLIVASLIQIVLTRIITGKFKKFQIWLFVIMAIMGTLTILFQNPDILKWKVTIIELIMAVVFFYCAKKDKQLLGLALKVNLPSSINKKITMQWCYFSIFIAILNVLVGFGLPQIMENQEAALNYWVNFKVWGVTILSLVLAVSTAYQLMPHIDTEQFEKGKNKAEEEKPMLDEDSIAQLAQNATNADHQDDTSIDQNAKGKTENKDNDSMLI